MSEPASRRQFLQTVIAGALAISDPRRAIGHLGSSSRQLEIIAASLEDAQAAATGGATRVELTSFRDGAYYTPPLDLLDEVRKRVALRCRVFLRERPGFVLTGAEERTVLLEKAKALASRNLDGIVVGFIRDGQIDLDTLTAVASAAPQLSMTVHNVVEMLADPPRALTQLKAIPSIDRVLVYGGTGTFGERMQRLKLYKRLWEPRKLVVNGFEVEDMPRVLRETGITEFHDGEAVRTPRAPFPAGAVDSSKVRNAWRLLQRA